MGSQAVGEFARFYTVPGYGHGPASRGAFLAAWDSLSALDGWVEKGTAPAAQTVADRNEATKGRTRPLCEYPSWPKYSGSGDVNAAASFTCTAPVEASR